MEKLKHNMAEYVGRVKSSVEKRIPIKPKSFEELIAVIEREGALALRAEVVSFFDSGSTGVSGSFGTSGMIRVGRGFESNFESATPDGRRISHREYYGYMPIERGDPEEAIGISRALITAERRLQQIQGRVGGMTTELIGPDGKIGEDQRCEFAAVEVDIAPSLSPRPNFLLIENKVGLNRLDIGEIEVRES